jgi:hypothetical protein
MKFYQLQITVWCAFCTGKQYRFSLVYDFTTTKPTQAVADYTTLKFSDEFNTDGAPDPSKWTYDLGTGDGGWGNGEAQTYTSSDNVIVAGGNLKTPKKSR